MVTKIGTSASETILGTLLADVLYGRAGNDAIFGNAGDDRLYGEDGNDRVNGSGGNDLVRGGDGNDTVHGHGGDDKVYGDAGNDRVFGDDGNDLLRGGEGNDSLYGGSGDDVMYGDGGDDYMRGGTGNDRMYGGTGNDRMIGDAGDDTISGQDGDDILHGRDGADLLLGGAGVDYLRAGADDDRLFGGTEGDRLLGEAGNDELYGEAGNDTLEGGTGDDILRGGDDIDTAVFTGPLADYDITFDGTDYTVIHARGTTLDGTDTVNVDVEKMRFADQTIDLSSNNQPVAVDDSGATDADALLSVTNPANGVLDNDSDLEATLLLQTLSITEIDGAAYTLGDTITLPSGALLTVNGDGTYEYDPNGAFAALDAGDVTTDSFTYTIDDGAAGTATATVTITLTGTNDGPVGSVAITGSGNEDGPAVVVDLVQGVTDPEDDPLSITGLTQTAGRAVTPAVVGTALVLNTTGFDDLAVGQTEVLSFSYDVEDGQGGTLSRTLDITISGTNDAPVATAVSLTTPATEDAAYSFDVATLFSDVDVTLVADTLTYTVSGLPAGVVFDGTQTISGTPSDSDIGAYTVSITVDDGNGGSLTRTFAFDVDNVNDDPVAVTDTVITDEDVAVTFNAVANDTDADGDALSVTVATVTAGNGTVVINPDGTLTYTPAADDNGSATITYTVSDGNGGTDATGTVNVTITPINDDPDAGALLAEAANEDGPTTAFDLLVNATDVDVPADTLSATNLAQVSGPVVTAVINGSNELEIDMTQAAFQGLAEGETVDLAFTFDVEDGAGGSDGSAIVVTVTGVNDQPMAVADVFAVDEDNAINFNPAANDTDLDGDVLSVTGVTLDNPADGVIAGPNGDGTWTFTPAANFNGAATFTYTVDDGSGAGNATASGAGTINVAPINDAPVAADGTLGVGEDDVATAGSVAVTDVDNAVPGDQTYSIVGVTPDGLAFNPVDGTFTYTAPAAYQALDTGDTAEVSFAYRSNDGSDDSNVAVVTITINGANDAPVGVADSGATDEATATSFDVTGNDTDAEGHAITVDSIDTVSVTASDATVGVPLVGISGGSITFDPNGAFEALGAGETATIAIAYTPTDGTDAGSQATLTVTVTGVNDGPVISNGAAVFSIDENNAGGAPVGTVAATDADENDTLSYNIVGGTGAGLFAVDASGNITASAVLDYETATSYTLDVLVTDGKGGETTASYTVNVGDVNDVAPEITNVGDPLEASVVENTGGVVLDVDATDADTVGGPLVYSLTGGDAAAFSINGATGEISFAAAPNFEAPTDAGGDNVYETTVEVSDGVNTTTRAITITVTDDNTEFSASAITDANAGAETVAENAAGGTLVGITATASDDDGSDTISYSLDDSAGGRFAIDGTTGVVTVAGPIDREAAADHAIIVRATSTDGSSTTANYTIAVSDVDEFDVTVPVDTNLAANTIAEDATTGALTGVSVSATDDDATTNTITYGVSDARFEIVGNDLLVKAGAMFDAEIETSIAVTVTALSADGSTSSNTFTIAVTDVDDENPVLVTTGLLADENQTAAGSVVATDVDTAPAGLTYTLVAGAGDTDNASFTIAPDGTLTFVGAPDFEAPDGPFSIRVHVEDPAGNSTEGVVTVTVADVNEDPVITSAAAFNVDENTTSVATLTSTDVDAVGMALWTITGGADAAKFVIDLNTGGLSFVGGQDFESPTDAGADGTYDVEVTVFDGEGGSATQAIAVTLTDVNEAPTAVALAGAVTIAENTVIGAGIKVADIVITDDATGTNDITVSDPVNFSVVGTELFFIGASPDFESQASYDVTVTVNDATATPPGGASQLFTLVITDVNEAPVAVADIGAVSEDAGSGSTVVGSLLANDSDVDAGQDLDVADVDGNLPMVGVITVTDADGTLTVDAETGAYSYSVDNVSATVQALGVGETLVKTFNYNVTDDGAGPLTAGSTLTITIHGTNDGPVATNDAASVTEDTTPSTMGNVLTDGTPDSDVDGDSLTVTTTAAQIGAHGTLTLNAAGDYTYTLGASPAVDALGDGETLTDSFTYSVSDGNGGTSTATIAITINGTNDAPTLVVAPPAPTQTSGAAAVAVAGDSAITDAEGKITSITLQLAVDDNSIPGDTTLDAADALGFDAGFATTLTSLGFTVSGDGNGTALTISTTPGNPYLSTALLETVLENVKYTAGDTSFDFNANDRTVTVTVTDHQGKTAVDTVTVDMAADVTDTGTTNVFVGGNLADTISGLAGDDTITGNEGDDIIDGGDDIDTAVYAGNRADYTVTIGEDAPTGFVTGFSSVQDDVPAGLDEGTDTLTSIERLEFADVTLELSGPIQLFDADPAGAGTGNLLGTFTTIVAAIAAAADGDVILVNGVGGVGSAPIYTGPAEDITISAGITLRGLGDVTVSSISIDGGGAGQAIDIDNVDVTGTAASLIDVDDASVYTSITFQNGDVTGGNHAGFNMGDPATGMPDVGSVTISDAVFDSNATVGGGGAGPIVIFGYNGDVTLTNVTVQNPTAAQSGIQIKGADTLAEAGDLTFTNVSVTGDYTSTGVAIRDFSDVTGHITFDGLTVTVAGGAYAGMQLESVGGDVDLSDGAQALSVTNNTVSATARDIQVDGLGDGQAITGDVGRDWLIGNGGDDTITGLGGDDLIIGGAGTDTLDGGEGSDQYVEFAGDGGDAITDTGVGGGDVDILGIFGSDTTAAPVPIPDGTADDTVTIGITGGAISSVDGGAVSGIEGAGINLGGNGATGDTLSYADTLTGNDVTVDLAANVATGFALGANNIENATGGAGDDTLAGTATANTLSGGDGDDTLTGRDGDDILIGGNDTHGAPVGSPGDTAVYVTTNYAPGMVTFGVTDITVTTGGAEGTDTLTGVETIQFVDRTVHIVDASGTFGAFTMIQDAVDFAADGDVIYIMPGDYSG